MAITRRQFVTRLGALAAVVGFSQAEVSKIAEAFAGNATPFGAKSTAGKPRVIWIHGAECTGCSTSLLGILEAPGGHPLVGDNTTTTLAALGLAKVEATSHTLGVGGVTGETDNLFTLWSGSAGVPSLGIPANVSAIEGQAIVNIADVVIDVIDLQYHETVMGMGGDLAAQWLNDFVHDTAGAGTLGADPFVLVVEGALQNKSQGGAWADTAGNGRPWCSIGCSDDFEESPLVGFEIDMADTVVALAKKATCKAIIPIGQCAAFGGYPGCKPPISLATAGWTNAISQTEAMGVTAYLDTYGGSGKADAIAKVINVPGCPTNPWWFVLTVVLFMADFAQGGGSILDSGTLLPRADAVDASGRLKAVYPIPVHSAWCPRYRFYKVGKYAQHPGDAGCLQKLGCKGIATNSLCGIHGWNNQQPENPGSLSSLNPSGTSSALTYGGHCTRAGHPCMACTEKGYPDSFVPYVKL